jgi:hypothetical protein
VVWLLYRLRGLKIAVDQLFEPVDSFFRRRDIPSQVSKESPTIYPIPDAIIEELRNLRGQLALNKVVPRLNVYKESISGGELRDRVETTITYVRSLDSTIDDFIEQGDKDKVYYMTGNSGSSRTDKKALELKSSLVESQSPFGDLVSGYDSLVMTSATLTAGGDFSFLKERLGITDPRSESRTSFKEVVIGSPFDHKRQSLFYLDKGLPPPNKENNETFWQKGLKVIEGLINASRGRALVLFTSYKHLHFVSKHITIDYPFKSQGGMPPARLIHWFKKTSNSVLLATTTFWQGIDIKGEKLSLVIIVKMPFGSPGDPVYDERCRRLKTRWFTDLALPSAIFLLRQGLGRLIRGTEDYGVVAILDTRLITSSYGRTIVSSLPEMDIVHSIENVKMFFDSIPQPVFSSKRAQSVRLDSEIVTVSQGQEIDLSDAENSKGISRVVTLGNSSDPSVIHQLIDFTRSKNGNERRLAASALGKLVRFRPEIYKAVEALEGLLGDEKPQVRQYALKALSRIGKVNQERLESILNNPDEKGYNISMARMLIKKAEEVLK